MSMVVRTNTMAIGANSALNKNNSTVAGNLQKLSSGFRINRAADDASGLAVSEKMKAQIKALDQAGKNAQDGASLIKTAEGYMGEIHDMLNRIVELAEKSANGTYETNKADGTQQTAAEEAYGQAGVDRQAIQDEVDQLTTEINRIAKTANFNGLKLLDGSLDAEETGAEVTKYTYATATAPAGTTTYADSDYTDPAATITSGNWDETNKENLFVYDASATGEKYTAVKSTDSFSDSAVYKYRTGSGTTEYTLPTGENTLYSDQNGTVATVADITAGKQLYTRDAGTTVTEGAGAALKLQIGETSGAADKLEVSIKSFKTDDLFANLAESVKTPNTSAAAKTAEFENTLTINVSNQESASKAAEEVRKVINEVSSRRATLGAMENRLDYTMNNLDTASQNITDANSRIRDTDMAKTMMEYTQGNTLTQAAQAMLAQANQAPSQVLQLLQ